MAEAQEKLKVRPAACGAVSGAKWVLGSRILTTAAHALIENLINYGLTATGSAAMEGDAQQPNTQILHPTARRIAAVGPSIRRGVLFTLADLRTTQNHYLLKKANLTDRAMRAGEPQIEQNAERYLQRERFWGDGELGASPNRLPPMNR